jgi:hypothetical protein
MGESQSRMQTTTTIMHMYERRGIYRRGRVQKKKITQGNKGKRRKFTKKSVSVCDYLTAQAT